MVSSFAVHAQLSQATICAGAARLDNGSIVTLGQPFAGVMSAPGNSVVLSSGFVPVFEQMQATSSVGPISPGSGLVSGNFSLGFPATPGRNYVVLASTNLAQWTPIWTTNAVGPWVDFADPGATGLHQRFYQVRSEP